MCWDGVLLISQYGSHLLLIKLFGSGKCLPVYEGVYLIPVYEEGVEDHPFSSSIDEAPSRFAPDSWRGQPATGLRADWR